MGPWDPQSTWAGSGGRGDPRGRSQASPAVGQATGDRNKLIMIWDAATCKRLHIFTGHRDAVSVSQHDRPRCRWGWAATSSPVLLTAAPLSTHPSAGSVLPEGHAPAVQRLP